MTPGVKLTGGQDENNSQEYAYLNKTLELYEITNRMVLSRNSDYNATADPRLSRQNDGGIGAVMQLEEAIVQWETSLPLGLRLENFQENQENRASDVMYRQALLLRLR